MVRQRIIETTVDSQALFAALKKLPKEIQDEIRDSNYREAQILTGALKRGAVSSQTPQAKLLVAAIKPKRDRVVKVEIGGSKQVGKKYKSRATGRRKGASAGSLVFGSEYGSTGDSVDAIGRAMGDRFVQRTNRDGYWIQPTVARYVPDILQRWVRQVQKAIDR